MNFRKINIIFLTILLTSVPLSTAGAAAPAMNFVRQSHTTTLLADGNILLTGGANTANGAASASVEMYNMATNKYENWGALNVARSSHTATLMSNGKILIAGGFAGAQPMNSVEVCDPSPAAKTCTTVSVHVMSTPRGGHTATLLSKGARAGQVMLCGGQSGVSSITISGTCDFFDPANTNAVPATVAMKYPRMGHAATLLYSGKVFITGGKVWDPAALNGAAWLYLPATEIYDPVTNIWSGTMAALLQGRIDHTVTTLNNGVIMIAGGFNSTTTYHCLNSVGEECWTANDFKYWGYNYTNQNMGSHGFLDGAEYFDQNGGRTVVGESSFGVTPYRVNKHSAALLPDGSWTMFGGYGNIGRTMYPAAPSLETDTVFYLVNGVVQPNSVIDFRMTQDLSRAVSGRLVDANAYFAKTYDGSPAFEWSPAPGATIKIYLNHSTAALDGLPVGTMNTITPGLFDNIVTLENPVGSSYFLPQTFQSDAVKYTTLTVISSALSFGSLFPLKTTTPNSPLPYTGTISARLGLILPNSYKGIQGTALIESGSIMDSSAFPVYSMSIKTAGSVAFNFPVAYIPIPVDDKTSLFIATANFLLTGDIANLSSDTTVYSILNASGSYINLKGNITFNANEVRPGLFQPTYNFSRSDIVIREMVFSSVLGFSPKKNSWKDLANVEVSPSLGEPVFDHTTLLTPAADMVTLGGRNCEADPANDCLRLAKTFNPRKYYSVFIPSPIFPDGTTNWPAGESLNSKRAFHTSTLLLSGQILTCGGSDGSHNLASCELMDPETKIWTPTGSMNYPRAEHTATLLPNGTVLVTGGVTSGGSSLPSAEIFYPATQRWIATESMKQQRQKHTATLLPDGNVLVAGGDNAATAELYISSNASWQNVGSMTLARAQHTATLLKTGNVLMVGGKGPAGGALHQTEIYNSLARTFSVVASLNVPRYAHTANLLRDGRVLVAGGSNNLFSGGTSEIYDSVLWVDHMTTPSDLFLTYSRTNHRSVLLPNGKVIVTGGEIDGYVTPWTESYDPDFSSWVPQGKMAQRTGHTSVLTRDNFIINIGGSDGSKNLDTTDAANLLAPDGAGLAADTTRQMIISTATSYFDHGMWATVFSTAANFHGVTEASGGGAGSRNSSFSNPRVYMNQIDNPSGFMIDLSTRIYSLYGGQNTNWETTLSSITIITPSLPGEMPYGWYTMRVAANGVFSEGVSVQVTIPRPTGAPSVPTGVVLGVSSINWSWNSGTIPLPNGADGYNIYASSNDVFVATTAFTATASYTQTGMRPNTEASLMVNSYNIGGTGPLSRSTTYYTLASPPTSLTITGSSFETASLVWGNNGNTAGTLYELSMYACIVGDSLANCGLTAFSDTLSISTPIPFNVNFASTSTSINQLSPNQGYIFRVRAENGAGFPTAFSNSVSTLTVGNVSNLTGTAISSSAISWSWDESTGADAYEMYDISEGTAAAVFIGSTTFNYLIQTGLAANRPYSVSVNAVKTTPLVKGPPSSSSFIYTLAVQPGLNTLNTFTSVSTGSITANWMTNGNSAGTSYNIQFSTSASYPSSNTVTVSTNGNSVTFGGLTPNTRYYAQVYAINGEGRPTAVTALGSKFTRARAPAEVTPAVISMSGVTLTWDQNGNSTTTIYEVRYTTETFDVSSTTYIPFSAGFTGNSFAFPGLLTATTYYFDVAARNFDTTAPNGEGYVTARIEAVPAAYTLAGPSGAPSGSIGGTSDPKKNVTISGVLPTGRAIALAVPSGTFPAATAIAISSSAQNPCGYLVGGIPIEVAVFSQDSAQPQVPVTLTISFTQPEAMAAIDNKRQNMVLARYNPVSGQCLPLETTIDTGRRTITATLNHFSLFQLMLKTAATNLSNVLIYPNPFYGNRGNGFVTITNMPASASVRIYTLSGDKVWEGSAGTTGMLIWKGQNKSGELVASGVYLAVIDSTGGKKVFKLAVER